MLFFFFCFSQKKNFGLKVAAAVTSKKTVPDRGEENKNEKLKYKGL